MGIVYGCTWDGRAAAVKVLTAEKASEPAFLRAFRAEIQAMATLSHPNVVRVHGFGVAPLDGSSAPIPPGSPWVVMDLAPQSLAEECGQRPWADVRRWLEQLLEGLAHAHARGITHRDLKPANVLLQDGVAKLADFGLARAFESVGTGMHEQPAGTPGYMPPEQRHGRWRDIGPWTDLYALGRVALDLVTLPRGGTIPVPTGFAGWIARLRQERALDRYRRASDALHALRSLPEEATHPLEGLLGGVGPNADSTFALTEPYFEDQDTVAQALPDPLAVVLPPIPESPLEDPGPADPRFPANRPRGVAALEWAADALWQAVRRASEGRVELVVLRGPRGSGKRDLAMWLCHQLHETGAGSVDLATHDAHLGPRSGLSGMLARELRCFDLDRSAAFERVSSWLRDLPLVERPAPLNDTWEAAALVAVMAPALGPGERPNVSLGPPDQRFELIARFLERDAEGRVPLVWLDGLHHARDTLAWVRWFRRRGGRVLLLATTEHGRLDDELAELGAEILDLPDPTAERVERTIVRPLGIPPGPLSTRLAGLSGGDALIARFLVEDWRAAGILSGNEIVGELPTAVDRQLLWRGRLDALLAGRGRFAPLSLACAAVLGDEVNQVRWRDLCRRARIALDESIVDLLLVAGFATGVGLGDAGDWRFASQELADVLMRRAGDQLPRLHRAAALTYRVEPETVLKRAHHLCEAGDPAGAIAALRESVEPLVTHQDWTLLRGVIDRLEGLVPAGTSRSAEEWVWIDVGRLALDMWQGRQKDVLDAGPEVTARAAAYPAAWGVAGLLVGRSAHTAGQQDRAEQYLEQVRTLAGTPQDALAAEADGYLGILRIHQGRYQEALELLDLADARRRDPAVVLGTAIFRARAHKELGDPVRAESELQAVWELAASAGGWIARAAYANAFGELCRQRGDLDGAAQHYQEAFESAWSAHHTNAWVYLTNLAFTDLLRGRDAEAERALERAIQELAVRGHVQFTATARLLMLVIAARTGDRERWDVLRDAVDTLERIGAVDPDLALAAELAAEAMTPLDPERAAPLAAFAERQRRRRS